MHLASDDIFQRHIDDRRRDQGFDKGWKPQCVRSKVISRSNQRDGMRDRERSNDEHKLSQFSKRNHQAEEKQKMIRPVEDVKKPQFHKLQRRLMPSWIESNQAGIAGELEGTRRSVW